MSTRARQAVLLTVLAVVVIWWAQLPGSMLSFGRVKHFPDDVVATVPPTPNVYGDKPDVRVLQLMSSLNTMWDGVFRRSGDRYTPPQIEEAASDTTSGCGGAPSRWSGLYCTRNQRIYVDMGDHLVIQAAAGDATADDMLGYVLAHEVGHHVQYLRGGVPQSADQALRRELNAECLAGVWGKAAGRALPPAWTYRTDAAHGSAEQQRAWLERGYAHARPADCDGVWDARL